MGVPRPFYVDSPSTLEDNEDGLDISTDPDLRHDKLPQPFRLVNKIVEGLFEGSWESITARMAEKEKGADCKKLPDLEGGVTVTLPYKLHSVCCAGDKKLLIGAGAGGLLAYSHDDVTRPLYRFNIEGGYLEVVVANGAEADTYIIAALDKEGLVTLFGLTRAGFIEISQLSLAEKGEKILKLWLDGGNLAISVIGTDNSTSVMFYNLPVASWSDPLETLSAQRLQGNEEEEQVFSKPELRGRVKQPCQPAPNSKNNLTEALAPIMATLTNPTPLGRGTLHFLPTSAFQNRREMLGKLPKYADVDWNTVDTSVNLGHVVFVGDGKVAVWWTNHHVITLHSLSSDVETVLDCYVHCSHIRSVAASPEVGLLAVGLQQGIVSLIDRNEGLTVQTSLVSRSPVTKLQFVDTALLAACQDGVIGVVSRESGCALVQHLLTDAAPSLSVSHIHHLSPFSNLAVVSLCPGCVSVVDVGGYRAIVSIPVWPGASPVCMGLSDNLSKQFLCVLDLDQGGLASRLGEIHPLASQYYEPSLTGSPDSQTSEMFVYDTAASKDIAEKGYVSTNTTQPLSLSLLSLNYFAKREEQKSARHERLTHRWYQYTEELECF